MMKEKRQFALPVSVYNKMLVMICLNFYSKWFSHIGFIYITDVEASRLDITRSSLKTELE